MVALYQHKSAVGRLRHPFIPVEEMRDEKGNLPKFNDETNRHQGLFHAYQRRWEGVASAHDRLSALLQEAEAVWGEPLAAQWHPIALLENELFFALEEHLREMHPDHREINSSSEKAEEIIKRRKLLGGMGGDGDEFSRRFSEAMKPVEETLRKKLGPKKWDIK